MTNNPAPERNGAVVYCRVSSKEQEKNLSLPVQEQTCREYCARHGWEVVRVFKEAESAKTVDRTQFHEMLEFCALNAKAIAAVVFYDTSRFSRETADYHSVRGYLRQKGIATRSATQGFDNSPAGEFIESVLAASATLDNRIRAMKTVEGMKAAQRIGRWVHKAPLGYNNVPNAPTDQPNLLPDQERAPLLRLAFDLYSSGAHSKSEVLKRVTDLGLRDTAGGPVSPQTFDKILRNPVYAGWIVSGWGIKARGLWEPLVSEELFARVQTIMEGKHLVSPGKLANNPEFPLRVFLRCGVCGTPLTASFSTGKLGGKYAYYYCREKNCRKTKYRRERLDVEFIIMLERLRPQEQFWPLFEKILADVWNEKQKQQQVTADLSAKRVAALEERKQRLIDLLVEGKLKQQLFDEQIEKVEAELAAVGQSVVTGLPDEDELERLVWFAKWLLENAGSAWYGADYEKKIRIQNAIFPSGLAITMEGFQTPTPCSVLSELQASGDDESILASLITESWNPLIECLQRLASLRDAVAVS